MKQQAQAALRESAPALTRSAHLLLCEPKTITDPLLLSRYIALLDPAERARLARIPSRKDAHAQLVAQVLVRAALSQFKEIDPAEWRFRTDAAGRPELDGPLGPGSLRFSLSRCGDLVACLVAPGADCGIAVQEADESTFAAACPSPGLAMLLKDAYLRAREPGPSTPRPLALHLDGRRISFGDGSAATPMEGWSFALWRPVGSHVIATAVRQLPRASQPIVVRRFVPLVGMGPALPPCEIASSQMALGAVT